MRAFRIFTEETFKTKSFTWNNYDVEGKRKSELFTDDLFGILWGFFWIFSLMHWWISLEKNFNKSSILGGIWKAALLDLCFYGTCEESQDLNVFVSAVSCLGKSESKRGFEDFWRFKFEDNFQAEALFVQNPLTQNVFLAINPVFVTWLIRNNWTWALRNWTHHYSGNWVWIYPINSGIYFGVIQFEFSFQELDSNWSFL